MKWKNYAAFGLALTALSVYLLSFGPWQTWLGAFCFAWGEKIVGRAIERSAKRRALLASLGAVRPR